MDFEHERYWVMLIRRSVARFFLLAVLHQRAMHGYELAKAISEACCGCCQPSDAMIYPALHDLLKGGYVECLVEIQGGRQRKVHRLTEKGEEAYRVAAAAWQRIIPTVQQAAVAALDPSERGGYRTEVCTPAKPERRADYSWERWIPSRSRSSCGSAMVPTPARGSRA